MSNQLTYRPVGYSDSTVRLTNVTNEIEITAYLWGGGGGAGGSVTVPNGLSWQGGNGTGSGFASVTFTITPNDNIVISVGGGGSVGSTPTGGNGGKGFVLGSTSFTGATGGNGANAGGGGGSGAATALWKNGILLAVAAGGGGGGGASLTASGGDAPTAGNAPSGVFAGQNGQSKNIFYSGGGGGGAGGGGYAAGNGATLDLLPSPGAGGGVGFSLGDVMGMPQGINPAQASNPYRRGAGRGGSHLPDVNGFSSPNGTSGVAVLVFSYVPGFSIKNNGIWQPIKKTYIKINGDWVEVKDTYIRVDGEWQQSINGLAPNFVNVPGQFGYAPRAIDPQPAPPAPPPPPPPPPPPVVPTITGFFSYNGVTGNDEDQLTLSVTGPDSGSYNYNLTATSGATFNTFTGNLPTGILTLPSPSTKSLNLNTPHDATTVTAIISRPGYNSFTASLNIPARPVLPPTPTPIVLGSFTGPTYISEIVQDQVRLTAQGPDAGSYDYIINANPGVLFDTSTGNPPNGTLAQYQTAAVNLVTPHPATTLTAILSRPGYISYQGTLQVPARAAPRGFVEFVRAGTNGMWTIPPGVYLVRITLVGGGGGGAAGSENNPFWSGGGGGGSGGINQFQLGVIPGGVFSYVVGIGGAGTGRVGAGGRPGNSGTDTSIIYSENLTRYSANGGTGGGTSGGNVDKGHWNGAGVGGFPGGTNGIAGQSRAGASAGRNLMSGGPGGSAAPFGFGGLAAPGVPEGGPATDANQNGQSATGYGAGGGGGAGGKNDAPQGQGGAGTGGYIRIEWG